MNTRDYKRFAEGEYYHVFNRGVNREEIFKEEGDYSNFIKRLKLVLGQKEEAPIRYRYNPDFLPPRPLKIKPLPNGAFDIVCYCLMPNHFHFLMRQNGKTSITEFVSKLCTSYSMYFNKKYDRVGGLFQDAFKAINVSENSYLLWLSAYIHQNPAVAGLVLDLKKWKWSSFDEYVASSNEYDICDKSVVMEQFKGGVEDYQKFLSSSFKLIKQKKAELNSDRDLFLD